MARRTAEKAQKQEPELIIPVDEFNRDKLGEHVARKISSFISRKARRFGMPLHDAETLQAASECLDNYFKEVCGENLSPDMRRVIHSVRLSINRYDKLLGIDLVSVNVEPRDEKGESILIGGRDLKAPTLGVVGTPPSNNKSIEMEAVGFEVKEGAEQLHVLSRQFGARGFGIGERMPAHNRSALLIAHPWERGDKVTIPAGAMVAVDVPVVDYEKFRKQNLPHHYDQSWEQWLQGVYFCRYLTREAVMELLK